MSYGSISIIEGHKPSKCECSREWLSLGGRRRGGGRRL